MMDWRRLLSARRLGHEGADRWTPGRSPFQKDWDRVVFSSAFRRLQDKTQVHSQPANDYVRTRLTHSLEVSSVGRSLGAAVGQAVLQQARFDPEFTAAEFGHIVAAACLAHDIGNPPFGHFGEDTIRAWFAGPGQRYMTGLSDAQRQDFLDFEGNAQGFRVVTRLQDWRDAGGLRLTCATLATFSKYPHASTESMGRRKFGFFAAEADLFAAVADECGLVARNAGGWMRHPLAFLVEAADDICYRVVDLEDGFKLGRIEFDEAEGLLRELVATSPPRYREIAEKPRRIRYLRAKAIGRLVDLVTQSFADNRSAIMAGAFGGDLLRRTEAWPILAKIETITRARIFQQRDQYERIDANRIVAGLLALLVGAVDAEARGQPLTGAQRKGLAALSDRPPKDAGPYRRLLAVTDFVSGMTDTYAQSRWRELCLEQA